MQRAFHQSDGGGYCLGTMLSQQLGNACAESATPQGGVITRQVTTCTYPQRS